MIRFNSAEVIGRFFRFFVCGSESGSGSHGVEAEAEDVDGLAASTSLLLIQIFRIRLSK